jgi:branched-chain amino acid transport system ATP-binding protein
MLKVHNLQVYYGYIQVIFGIDLEVSKGEINVLLGANGAGKSTTLKTISGILKPKGGNIEFQGRFIAGFPPYKIVRFGITLVPEGREIFPNLTVRENLKAGEYTRNIEIEKKKNREQVIQWFPILGIRMNQMAGTLSGGEQQMLAIARAFLTHPVMLLLDEPSLGLSPLLVKNIFQVISKMNKESGLTILLAEQNVKAALSIAHYGYVLDLGRITIEGENKALLANHEILKNYLGYNK